MANCEISPISGFQSTNLNNRIDSFSRLGDRVLRTLGHPFINVEVHRDQLYENISIACEYFTKFAGYTKEYLIFDSRMYKRNYGIKLDELFTLQNSDTFKEQKDLRTRNPDFTKLIEDNTVYISTSGAPGSLFTGISSLSSALLSGIDAYDIFTSSFYNNIITEVPTISSIFKTKVQDKFTVEGSDNGNTGQFVNSFDYDLMDYRKVIAMTDFEEGSSTGVNTLFTIEQTMAQQTYFSYAMGNYGFDLVSWFAMKDWMETREKLLATRRSYTFDERTQIMRMYPQPNAGNSDIRFYGVISCYVERPIRDIIKELWVYQYTLALTKMVVANIRGKYGSVSLFGGGSVNSTDLMTQGLAEKQALEEQLLTGAAPGQGDADPAMFFVG
tara:strand:- start:677 stop:1831 length:1155 start_codon:yes stop_codon:yes gene_type:complete